MQLRSVLSALSVALLLTSCSKNNGGDTTPTPGEQGTFILTVTPAALTGVADYLLTSNSLETGSVTTASNGIEQDGTYRYYLTTNNKFFSMLYGQGNPGAVTAYDVKGGKLAKLTNFQTETVQAFAPVNDDILLFKISRNPTTPTSTWYKVNTNSLLITGEGSVNTQQISGTSELAFFSWLKQVGTKVYAPYFNIQGTPNGFNTAIADNAYIAVFNYADMKLEQVIKDERTSFIGRYFTDGLSVTENGDVYAFSSSVATSGGVISSVKPSAITRIKAGTTAFDQSYYFNFEEASGGLNITNWLYLGDGNFLVSASAKAEKGPYVDGAHMGIVNAANKTFKAVTGLPSASDIKSVTDNNYTPKDGKTGYIGLNLKDGTSFVYKIDASSATATRGIKVDGGTITAIQHLN